MSDRIIDRDVENATRVCRAENPGANREAAYSRKSPRCE
jgi:hypothetical protein